jgi:hypothetical protein
MDGEPLLKMLVGLDEGRVNYGLRLGIRVLPMNELIGGPFTIRFTGARTCTSCGKRVRKFYGQGLCYPCLVSAPEASECIVRPELCRAHLGEGRDVRWEQDHHNTEHFVYLSQTGIAPSDARVRGGIKVGVTRSTQIPVRWIDQGAVQAVIIARTPYRQLAGAIEVALKSTFADKTDWRQMLQPIVPDPGSLDAARSLALGSLPDEFRSYLLPAEMPLLLNYPHSAALPKVTSVSFEKMDTISGTLHGIKGQYLLWKDGRVFNVRNHAGYHVEVGRTDLFSDGS